MKNPWKKIVLAISLAPIAYRLYEWYKDIPASGSQPHQSRKKSLAV